MFVLQELNARATHLLYRDKKRQLHLYNITKQERVTLLPYCSYVQWVPGSDVVVAQSRNTLCVWYSINAPHQQTTINVFGEVEDIQRSRVSQSCIALMLVQKLNLDPDPVPIVAPVRTGWVQGCNYACTFRTPWYGELSESQTVGGAVLHCIVCLYRGCCRGSLQRSPHCLLQLYLHR